MNPSSNNFLTAIRGQLDPALPGMLFAVLTLIFGFGLGITFGLNEDMIKTRLEASAAEVASSVYGSDEAAIQAVLAKSWKYMQRAHLHAGGLGTAAIALILLTSLLSSSPGLTRIISLGLGVGGFGYSVFWLWAGFRTPGLGGTGAAKESLKWLAMPSAGALIVATVAVAVLLLVTIIRRPQTASPN